MVAGRMLLCFALAGGLVGRRRRGLSAAAGENAAGEGGLSCGGAAE